MIKVHYRPQKIEEKKSKSRIFLNVIVTNHISFLTQNTGVSLSSSLKMIKVHYLPQKIEEKKTKTTIFLPLKY